MKHLKDFKLYKEVLVKVEKRIQLKVIKIVRIMMKLKHHKRLSNPKKHKNSYKCPEFLLIRKKITFNSLIS